MQDLIDELDDNLDDLEPIVDNPAELYEHFRVVVDKGQKQVRIDKYLFERLVNSSRNVSKKQPMLDLLWPMGNLSRAVIR